MRIDSIEKLKRWRAECRRAFEAPKRKVIICQGESCLANGSEEIFDEFKRLVAEKSPGGLTVESVCKTGCHGFCSQGPLVVIEPDGTLYTKVKKNHVAQIIDDTLIAGKLFDKLLYVNPQTEGKIADYNKIPFLAGQQRISLRNCGHIDPRRISDAVAVGGYAALAKVLTTMTPQQVIDEVTKSNMRGRGGAGFPTGRKWATCANVESDIKYVICNGDESTPGAFSDCTTMGSDPHSILEGMIICAYAVGARQGYVYVREEYPLAVTTMQTAIDQAREHGLIGDNILGTAHCFDIQISRSGGAFVGGESSALMSCISGDVPEPQPRYIPSAIKGLHGKPTILNNVETFATIPVIIEKGADWFAALGTPKSSGTKAFSLAGKVNNTGLVEVPMGTTLREIIFDIGGGIADGRKFKAVQTGGPLGGCLPEDRLDLPVDYDNLTEAGSVMGSGSLIVMDDHSCMVETARYYLGYLASESCGKCVTCREGLYQLHRLCTKVTKGEAAEADLDIMEQLAQTIQKASLCSLGQSGPNPFLSTIKYFREEYLAHVREKKCPGGVCRSLITYVINDNCIGCMACLRACPVGAITGDKKQKHVIDLVKCDRCGSCYAVCRYEAIDIV